MSTPCRLLYSRQLEIFAISCRFGDYAIPVYRDLGASYSWGRDIASIAASGKRTEFTHRREMPSNFAPRPPPPPHVAGGILYPPFRLFLYLQPFFSFLSTVSVSEAEQVSFRFQHFMRGRRISKPLGAGILTRNSHGY